MKEWLIKNAPWLFSGIGIFILLGFYKVIRRIFENGKKPRAVVSKPSADEYKSNVLSTDPVKMVREINDIANHDWQAQQKARERYEGTLVEWSGTLYWIGEEWKNALRLKLWVPPKARMADRVSVGFVIDPSKNSWLHTLKPGAVVRFQGVIAEIHSDSVSLDHARVLEQ